MKRPPVLPLLAITALIGLVSRGEAADGTWNTTASGNWSDPTKWSGGAPADIADGSGFTATFQAPTPNTSSPVVTISVDTDRTIGNLRFLGTAGSGTHNFDVTGPATLTLAGGSTPTITGSLDFRTATVGVTLDGTQGLATSTTGFALELSGSNIYTGVTTVSTGILTIGHNNALGSTSGGTAVFSDAALQLKNGITVTGEALSLSGLGPANVGAIHTANNAVAAWTGNIVLNSSAVRVGASGASSVLTLSGAIGEIGGSKNLEFSTGDDTATQGTVVLAGASTYTGSTTIYRGTVKLDGGNDRLPTGTLLTLGATNTNSTFDLNGRSQQVSGLSNNTNNSSTRTVTNTSETASIFTVDSSANQSFLGDANDTTVISGNLSFVKAGSSAQTLAKTNSYTGNTTVSSGTLILADAATMTFYIGANGMNNGISGSGTLTLDGEFIFNLDGADLMAGNMWNIVNTGSLLESYGDTFAVQGFTESALNSGIWVKDSLPSLTFTESTGLLAVIPEPSAAALILIGGAAFGIVRRRRRG